MPITASAKSSQPRQLPPQGTHVARCYQIIDLGSHQKEWKGKKRTSHEIRVSWELPNERAVFKEEDGEQPFAVHQTYTLSLSEKANLRRDLETWRGRAFTQDELDAFDVTKVLGAACMVTVSHVAKDGNTYANVTAVTAVPKGFAVPTAVNWPVAYSIDDHNNDVFKGLPEFMQKIITESYEWKAKLQELASPQPTSEQEASTEEEGDGLPF